MENNPFGWVYPQQIAMFNSYVSLPEGSHYDPYLYQALLILDYEEPADRNGGIPQAIMWGEWLPHIY